MLQCASRANRVLIVEMLWGRNTIIRTTDTWQEATRPKDLIMMYKNNGPGVRELEAGLFECMRTV